MEQKGNYIALRDAGAFVKKATANFGFRPIRERDYIKNVSPSWARKVLGKISRASNNKGDKSR